MAGDALRRAGAAPAGRRTGRSPDRAWRSMTRRFEELGGTSRWKHAGARDRSRPVSASAWSPTTRPTTPRSSSSRPAAWVAPSLGRPRRAAGARRDPGVRVPLRAATSSSRGRASSITGAIARYGLETPGEGVKVAEHHTGPVVTAATRDFVVDRRVRARGRRVRRAWLPGLAPEPVSEVTCLYTNTATEDFVLDRVGPIVVVSPCSGHGFKFAPAIGRDGRRTSRAGGAPVGTVRAAGRRAEGYDALAPAPAR